MAHVPKNPAIAMRGGVSPSCVSLPRLRSHPWATVLDHLAERLPAVSRDQWMQRMRSGAVLDDAGQALSPQAPYAPGARVYYWRELPEEAPIAFKERIVFEVDLLVVADKPHFLPVTPGGRYVRETLLVRLKQALGCADLSPVHRIDRETAGLVLLCKRPQDRDRYQGLFRDRRVHKRYLAVAPAPTEPLFPLERRSRIEEDDAQFFRMREVDGEPNSHTRIDLLQARAGRALYGLEPTSGKRHQLRVHMNGLGLPIEGDQFYPKVLRASDEPEDFARPLQLLAQQLGFEDPVTGTSRNFESTLALDWPPTKT